MVFLCPSSWPASYVRSLLEGTRMNGAVMFHFFSWCDVGSGFAVMAGTSTTRLREQVVQGRASLCLPNCIHPIKAEYRERWRELGRQESALDY